MAVITSLNKLLKLQRLLVSIKRLYLKNFWGMNIHPTVVFSLSAKFDKTYPRGIYIGEWSYIAFDAAILTHDMPRRIKTDTRIGKNCFIGARSIILPGVVIGDSCIVGAGSVVTKNIDSGSVVAGNPARVIKSNQILGKYGQLQY